MSGMKPFRVEANLATTLSVERPIPLEGILYDVRFRADPETMGTPLDCISYLNCIPLLSAGFMTVNGLAGPMFSSETMVKSINLRSQAIDQLDTNPKQPKSETSINAMSPFRNSLRTYKTLEGVGSVYWFGIGNPEVIHKMLSGVIGIGALRSRGFGEVSEWIVEEIDLENETDCWFANSRIMRRLPVEVAKRKFPDDLPSGVSISISRPEPPLWVREGGIKTVSPTLHSMIISESDLETLWS